jgi:hypothetical protein
LSQQDAPTDPPDPLQELAAELRTVVSRSGLTLRPLARRIDTGRSTLQETLAGKRFPPSERVSAIATACDAGSELERLLALWEKARQHRAVKLAGAPIASANEVDDGTVVSPQVPSDSPIPPLAVIHEDTAEPPPARPRQRRRWVVGGVAVVAVGALAFVLAGLPDAHPQHSCETVDQYRVTARGDVLDAEGKDVGDLVVSDTFNVRDRSGQRYYGAVARTGKWGLVDSAKLEYLGTKCI